MSWAEAVEASRVTVRKILAHDLVFIAQLRARPMDII
jgi:hypothetical protein